MTWKRAIRDSAAGGKAKLAVAAEAPASKFRSVVASAAPSSVSADKKCVDAAVSSARTAVRLTPPASDRRRVIAKGPRARGIDAERRFLDQGLGEWRCCFRIQAVGQPQDSTWSQATGIQSFQSTGPVNAPGLRLQRPDARFERRSIQSLGRVCSDRARRRQQDMRRGVPRFTVER